MKPYYVVLSGARGNSGDDLIRTAAFGHFERHRPDRDVVRLDAWKPFDPEKLAIVNGAKALILLGGPALRYDTYGGVYPLTQDLDDIRVPIVMLGVGYRDSDGDWSRTRVFELSGPTRRLLDRIRTSGYPSGVRCFHTWNVLAANGYDGFLMAGCPAFYSAEHLGRPFHPPRKVGHMAFATGRMYLRNPSLRVQQEELIMALVRRFPEVRLTVALHDPIDRGQAPTMALLRSLEKVGVAYREVARDAATLKEFYDGVDLQVGYRVHAHLYMCSRNKPSMLLCEDGRGKGMRTTLGGPVLDAYTVRRRGALEKLWLALQRKDRGNAIEARQALVDEVPALLAYEMQSGFQRSAAIPAQIQAYWPTYLRVLNALP